MPRPRPNIDVEHIHRLRAQGLTLEEISKAIGRHPMTVWHWHKKGWIDLGPSRCRIEKIPADPLELRRRYEAGENSRQLAEALGMSRQTVLDRLKTTEAAHGPLTAAMNKHRDIARSKAHAAVRGRKKTEDVLANHAASQSQRIGAGEDELIQALRERGHEVIPQWPCGRYNIDILVGSIAVELWFHSAANFLKAARPNRIKQVRNQGKSLVCIQFRRLDAFLGNLNNLVAFLERANGDPAMLSKDWMIRCRAELPPRTRRNRDEIAVVPAPIGFFHILEEIN
ncbi:helix-turn-helix domain-containing protein [Burkholderia multivorans]|nr:helix-turn-helix domain-containing protein [Burkholderia multivorans]